jgi:hypothetical protein
VGWGYADGLLQPSKEKNSPQFTPKGGAVNLPYNILQLPAPKLRHNTATVDKIAGPFSV